MTTDSWRVAITNADVRSAKLDWQAARDGDASADKVALLFGDLQPVVHAQAQQIADEFRAERALSRAMVEPAAEG